MARSPARRRSNPYRRRGSATTSFVFFGPLVHDAVTNVLWPRTEMIRQRGGFVHQSFKRGSGRDRPADW